MNNSPTTLFDSYEQDFQQFIETIRPKLEGNVEEPAGACSATYGREVTDKAGTQTNARRP